MPSQRPPDLDANRQPVRTRPPDLGPDLRPVATSAKPSDKFSTLTPKNFGAVMDDVGRYERERTRPARELMPMIGGIAGGIVGGVPGAAFGGAAGAAVRQLERREAGEAVPATPVRAAADIALQGAVQGVGQGVGNIAARATGRAATWTMNRALNPPDRLAREFPELSSTLIDNALAVSKGGLKKARGMLVAAKAEANRALAMADAKGAKLPISTVTSGLNKTLAKLADSPDPTGGLNTLVRIEKQITAGRGAELTMAQADALKRQLQLQAKNFYASARNANGRTPVALMAEAYADMATALNEAIEQTTTQVGAAGYKAANYAAKEFIGATRAITHAIRPGKNLYQAMVRPGVGAVLGGTVGGSQDGGRGAAVGALAGAAMTSPGNMSRLAIGLGNPAVQAWIRQLPRPVMTALLEAVQATGGTAAPDRLPQAAR